MTALTRTARITGLYYLGNVITAVLALFVVRPRLFTADDPAATLANLVEHESLARVGVALELGMVVTQTLAAIWFYRLFHSVDSAAASAVAAFGLVNAVVGLATGGLSAAAVEIATDPFGDATATVHTLHLVIDGLWGAGALFFGLWLVPMGWCVLRSGWPPRALGWTLIGGGVGYVLSAFSGTLLPDAPAVTEALTLPAAVGELWMVGYLLVRASSTKKMKQRNDLRSPR